ncbi:unnamed protein product [Durusdinium trenchii]|uniref:Uncharacterized protein n=1 Tax=Durusdinium trenchii TaxID=1381693 RepID=A0ABP0QLC6_9DINO
MAIEPDESLTHEVMTTSRISNPSTLAEALQRSNEVHVGQLASLSLDKRLMGALDSACNRTCCGSAWLEHYMTALRNAPEDIQRLVERCPEQEIFRFGDGGTQKSLTRVRLPMVIGSDLILTWVSIIPWTPHSAEAAGCRTFRIAAHPIGMAEARQAKMAEEWLKRQTRPCLRQLRLQAHPIEPKLLGSFMEAEAQTAKIAVKWKRFLTRLHARLLWHVQGICLWLCRRPWLRYTPFPYPSIHSIQQWQLQAQQMVSNGSMSRCHLQRAQSHGAFTAGNLKEVMWLRDRLGWQTFFAEDPMLQGMLAAKSAKGASSKIRQEAVAEAKALADKAAKEGKEIEAGIKPVVQVLLNKAPASSTTSSSSGSNFQKVPPKPSKQPSLENQKMPQVAAPSTPSTTIESGSAGLKVQDIQELLARQDQKFQTMLSQVMSHMMSLRGSQMPVGIQTQGAMRYDMAAEDASMDGSMNHGWTPQEVSEMMSEQETQRLNFEVQGQIKEDEQDLLKGPFFDQPLG